MESLAMSEISIEPRVKHGPSIGTFYEKPIPEWIEADTVRYDFDRGAIIDRDGTMDMDQLAHGETVIAPGLIYVRQVPAPAAT
ncbi:MAG: hypothetical protein AB7F74_24200 [Parvibaculaceae bacterium]